MRWRMPFHNLAESVPVSVQAFRHQIDIVGFRRVHRVGCYHITL
jgi:hypothetical protein